jgi:hypothetical protein
LKIIVALHDLLAYPAENPVALEERKENKKIEKLQTKTFILGQLF